MCPEIRVANSELFKGGISPYIYGEFIEFLNDLIPGMWAERIRDRSFEGLTNPRMFYRKESDFPKPAWKEFRVANARFGHFTKHDIADVVFDLDERKPLVGTRSARITVGGTRNYLADSHRISESGKARDSTSSCSSEGKTPARSTSSSAANTASIPISMTGFRSTASAPRGRNSAQPSTPP